MSYRPRPLKESDRYRGRRRAPVPARSRYAATITTAVVSAGVVAWGLGAVLPDADGAGTGSPSADGAALADADQRSRAADRPGRDDRPLHSSINEAPQDVWVLPLHGYRVTSPFGPRGDRMHAGVDLGGIREGHPIHAVHDGTVIVSGWQGGYGYAVFIQHDGGLISVYGHNSKLYVKRGDSVRAGDLISAAGNTGRSYGVHLHLEIRVGDRPVNPIAFLRERGVDLFLETEGIYG